MVGPPSGMSWASGRAFPPAAAAGGGEFISAASGMTSRRPRVFDDSGSAPKSQTTFQRALWIGMTVVIVILVVVAFI